MSNERCGWLSEVRIPCKNTIPGMVEHRKADYKSAAIKMVDEAIKKMNKVEWGHRDLRINDVNMAMDHTYKALEHLRHVLNFHIGL